MSKALYRKYRSKTLDEVVGQKHITDILSRAIKQGNISHAYLFTGPRGVGKTSVARILAHEINQTNYEDEKIDLDIIEIDAASNNGVEDVRDLREKVQIAPVASKKKVYIIDEVHMLSKAAFNALLKTLEEPPEHVVFILATTNIEKLPATIISRTQRFSFRPISQDDAVNHLEKISQDEGIKINSEALKLIAKHGDGSFRDSISLLDQLSNIVDKKEEITAEIITNSLGLASIELLENIIKCVEIYDYKNLVKEVNQACDNGVDATLLINQLIDYLGEIVGDKPELLKVLDSLIDITKSSQPRLKLISTLGIIASNKPAIKSVALNSTVMEITDTVDNLRKISKLNDENEKAAKTKPEAIITKIVKNIPSKDLMEFDWNELLKQAKDNNVALYSVLTKCNYRINQNKLTVYCMNGFYKKKLDDPKYSVQLAKILQELDFYDIEIDTIASVLPPKDSQIAAIADIMGGGVEVKLE